MPICSLTMVHATLKSNHRKTPYHALGIFIAILLMQRIGAAEFKVGGSKGWTVPTDSNALPYNQWAEYHRFQIGDSLLFVYTPGNDSVLQVTQDDYNNCNTATPLQNFSDGHTSVRFNQSGPHYFISGNAENCRKNEKIPVIVMADRSNRSSNANDTQPAASPPSPPPSPGVVELTPSPAPVGEQSPSVTPPSPTPSGASSVLVNFIASFGTFIGSSLLFVL